MLQDNQKKTETSDAEQKEFCMLQECGVLIDLTRGCYRYADGTVYCEHHPQGQKEQRIFN